MMREARERVTSTMSLKPQDVHGYRDIIDMILEKYSNLGEIEPEHLEPHEREALEMFKEFEKRGDYRNTGGRIPVFG